MCKKDVIFVPQKVYLLMEEKTTLKQLYEAPAVEVVELKTEGIVCASLQDYQYGGFDEDD